MSERFTVGQIAKALGVSPSTVRRMEKVGVVYPERTQGGHRRYTPAMLDRMKEHVRRGGRPYRTTPHVTFGEGAE